MNKPGPGKTTARAVLYLRVSSARQLDTAIDIDPEGNSIATQRESCLAKARALGATIEHEFVEPGSSARSIEKRPVFKAMLNYLDEHRDVDYVIVYMRSRAFRNSVDAAITKRALSLFGVRIISCKEDFGTGPLADAMETVTDAFNQLTVAQGGEDIKQKLRHKLRNGGTISRAKVGYLNVRAELDGRLFNTIGVDELRAPLVRQAFELYATGDYAIDALQTAMADLGLTSRPSVRWPDQKVISSNTLLRMLGDPYYAGWVSVDGELIKGRHTPLVSQSLFDLVQEVLASRSQGGSRDRILYHYLKGMLYCGRCNQMGRLTRLIYTEAKGRNGLVYTYYLCRGRQLGHCDLPHLPVAQVEEAVCRHYRTTLDVSPEALTAVRTELQSTMDDTQRLTRELHEELRKQLAKLDAREARLIDLAADGLLDRAKIMTRSNAIKMERSRVQVKLTGTSDELAIGAERLANCLSLVEDVPRLYAAAPDETRRRLNQAFFHRLFLDDGSSVRVAEDELNSPFDEIQDVGRVYHRRSFSNPPNDLRGALDTAAALRNERRPKLALGASDGPVAPVLADIFPVGVSSTRVMVELRGFEPLTPSLRTRCATSCATAPRTSASIAEPTAPSRTGNARTSG